MTVFRQDDYQQCGLSRVARWVDYYPFGMVLDNWGSTVSPHSYTGTPFDKDGGIDIYILLPSAISSAFGN